MTEPVLSLRGISKRYGPLQVLKNVDLDVYPGEVVALLGENGAGKSTLSGIIAGSRTP
ncbi:ATP-binding cassette domain-containing protein, partial [Rhizobium sp. Pop5]